MSAIEQRKTGSRWLQVEGGYYVSLKEYVQASPTLPKYPAIHALFPDHGQQSVEAALWAESKRRKLGGEIVPYSPPVLSERQQARRQLAADSPEPFPASPEATEQKAPDENLGIYLPQLLRSLATVPSEETLRLIYPTYHQTTLHTTRLDEIKRRADGGVIVPLDHDLRDEAPQGVFGVDPVFSPPRPRHERLTEFDLTDDEDEDAGLPIRRKAAPFVPEGIPHIDNLDNPLSSQELAITIARLLNHDPIRYPGRRRSISYRDEVKQALYALVPRYQEKGTASMLVKVAEAIEEHIHYLVQREEPLFDFPPDQAKHGAILTEYLRNEFAQQKP